MVMIKRFRQPKKHLKKPVDVSGGEKIAAPGDVGHALAGIVHDDGQMVARRHLFAQDDRIPPALGMRLDEGRRSLRIELGEGERPALKPAVGGIKRTLHVDAQRESFTVAHALLDLGLCELLMQARIERCAFRVDRIALGRCEDLGARGKTGIEEPLCFQPLSGLRVDVKVLRLAQDRLLPAHAEPGEILEDARDKLLSAAGHVDVLDAHQKTAAELLRHVETDERRQRMAEMHRAVGARGEAEDRWSLGFSSHGQDSCPVSRSIARADRSRFANPGQRSYDPLAAVEGCYARDADMTNRTRSKLLRIIATDADLRQGVRALRRKCPHLARVHARTGDPPLRRHPPGFEGLARIIVGQQLSIASAQAIWSRVVATVRPMTPKAFLTLSDEALRSAGLSRGKVRTLRAACSAIDEGLDLQELTHAPEDDVHAALTAVPGIGPWSADIFLLFCLGRADAFAAGDLALQTAAMAALDLKERPSREALLAMAERWRPWRGVAAHLLWADYKLAADRRKNPKTT
jgi:DNA-3-methyladenine glycosylase II